MCVYIAVVTRGNGSYDDWRRTCGGFSYTRKRRKGEGRKGEGRKGEGREGE